MLQERLELSTFAFLRSVLTYKYDALTDCATGAWLKLGASVVKWRAARAINVRLEGRELDTMWCGGFFVAVIV